jgi:MFS family permease
VIAHLRRVRSVFETVFANGDLRRVQLAFAGFNAAEYGVWVAMLVYAYDQGGATTAGVVAVVQLVPAALFAPLAATLGDRHPPGRVLTWGYAAQAGAMGATAAVILADGPPVAAYALAAVAATAVTLTRPAQAALVPSLVRAPEELTSANVVSSWVESAGILLGPALAGVILGLSDAGPVFALFAAVAAVSALLVGPLGRRGSVPAGEASRPLEEALAGFRALAREPAPRVLVSILSAQFIVIGALDVLSVALAVEVLGMGNAGAGWLITAFGAGGLVGGVATAALVGRRRLAPPLVAAAFGWGAAFVLIGVFPLAAAALLLLVAAGLARSLLDVAGRTLLQRTARQTVLCRVFGVLEGLSMAGLAIGSILAPVLIAWLGEEGAVVATGLFLPVVVVALGRQLREIDRAATVPVVEIALLRAVPMFAPLAAPELEAAARSLVFVQADAGGVIVREGDVGDRWYVIADGEAEVESDGTLLRTLGRGDGFGEIALLREVPRTANVKARTRCRLYALEKEPFVAAVTGHPLALRAAADVIEARLPALAPID